MNKLKQLDYRYYIGIIIIALILVFGIIYILRAPKSVEAEWFNDSWYYRQQFDIYNNESSALTDFQVSISTSTLQLATLNTAGKTNSDFSDLRFTDRSGNLLDYWFEDDTDNMYRVYVKFFNLPANATSTLFMYYGNTSASDDRNGANVFEIYEDFSSLPSDWTAESSLPENWEIVSGELKTTGSGYGSFTKDSPDFKDFIVETNWKSNNISDGGYHGGLVFRGQDDAADHSYQWIFHGSTGNRIQLRTPNQTYPIPEESGTTKSNDVWYNLRLKVGGTLVEGYINDVENLSGDMGDTTYTTGKVGFQHYNNINYFDDYRVSKYTANEPTITLTSGVSEEKSTAPIAYWSFDEGYGTIAHDNTFNKNHGTLTNMSTTGTSTAWVDGKVGKSLRLDGVDDYVRITDDDSLDLGTNDLTISVWLKTGITDSNQRGVVDKLGGTPSSWTTQIQNGKISFGWWTDSFQGWKAADSIIADDEWHHIVIVLERSSETIYFYKDGSSDGSSVFSGIASADFSGTAPIDIGHYDGSSDYFDGNMDEVKIYDYALTTDQIKKVYNTRAKDFTNINLSSSQQDRQNQRNEGLIGFWKMDEDSWDGSAYEVRDYSGLENHGTSYGGAVTTSTAKYGRAGEFDGVDDYVDIGDIDDFDFGNNDFTVGSWARVNAGAGIYSKSFVSKWNTGASPGTNEFILSFTGSNNKPYFEIESGSTYYILISPDAVNYEEWIYVSGTRRNDYLYLYVNGESKGSLYIGDVAVNNVVGRKLLIGKFSSYEFDGQIDHLKIWNRSLSSQEISEEYTEGPAPIGYWSMDNIDGTTVYDQSINGNNGILSGGMTKSNNWKPGKVGQSLDFDGDDEYIDFGTDDSLNVNTKMSIEAWVKPDEIVSNASILGKFGSGGYGLSMMSSGRLLVVVEAWGNHFYSSNDALKAGEWTHILVTIDNTIVGSSYIKIYINGKFDTEDTFAVDTSDSSSSFRIGYYPYTTKFDGLIDEVKIYDYLLSPYQIAQEYNQGGPIAYWSFDEGQGTTAHDNSVDGNNGTLTNMSTTGTSTVWVDGKFGKALDFDGSNDYVNGSNDNSLDIVDEITIEAWVKPKSTQAVASTIVSKGTLTGSDYVRDQNYFLHMSASREIKITYGDGTNYQTETGSAISSDTWHHIVAILNGTNILLYIDGILDNSWNQNYIPTTGDNANLHIGMKSYVNSAYAFNGLIDEVKIYNYTLTSFDIQKEYSSRIKSASGLNLSKSKQDATSARADGLVGWWKMDEDSWNGTADEVIDYSGNDNHGVAVSGATTTSTAKYNRAGEFDGVDDYVNSNLQVTIGPGDAYTFSTWCKFDDLDNRYDIIASTNIHFFINHYENPYGVGFYGRLYDGNSVIDVSSDGADYYEQVDRWYHVVWVADRQDSQKMYLYIDGKLVDSDDFPSDFGSETFNPYIGGTTNSWYMNGSIDDVKIWNRALSSAEIEKEYSETLAPVGYWSMDNIDGTTVADQSGRGSNGTMTGGMTKSNNWKPGKVGQALDFDGDNDYVNCGNDTDLNFGDSSSYSISMWIKSKVDNFSGGDVLGKAGSGNQRIHFYVNNGTLYRWEGFAGPTLTIAKGWQYITYTYTPNGDNYGTEKFYENGKEVNSRTGSMAAWKSTGDWAIGGAGGSYFFNGLIDEVKIYNYTLTSYQIAQEYNDGAPVGYWSFDEGDGGVIHDGSDNLNHGTLQLGAGGNTVTSTAWQASADCKKGKCMDFDGTDDTVNCGDVSVADWKSMTVSTWINWDGNTTSGYGVFLFKGASAGIGSHTLNSDGKLLVQNGNGNFFSDNNGDISSNEWAYYTYVYNQEEAKEYIYINGVQKGEQSRTGDILQTGDDLEIVRDDAYTYSGLLDEVKIWNYALTNEDVKEDYNLGKGLYFK